MYTHDKMQHGKSLEIEVVSMATVDIFETAKEKHDHHWKYCKARMQHSGIRSVVIGFRNQRPKMESFLFLFCFSVISKRLTETRQSIMYLISFMSPMPLRS